MRHCGHEGCNYSSPFSGNVTRHMRSCRFNVPRRSAAEFCVQCNKSVPNLSEHVKTHSVPGSSQPQVPDGAGGADPDFYVVRATANGEVKLLRKNFPHGLSLNLDFHEVLVEDVQKLLVRELQETAALKIKLCLKTLIDRPSENEESYHERVVGSNAIAHSATKFYEVTRLSNLQKLVLKMVLDLLLSLENFVTTSSGISLSHCTGLDVTLLRTVSKKIGSKRSDNHRADRLEPAWISRHVNRGNLIIMPEMPGYEGCCLSQAAVYHTLSKRDRSSPSAFLKQFDAFREVKQDLTLSDFSEFVRANRLSFRKLQFIILRYEGNELVPMGRVGSGPNLKHIVVYSQIGNEDTLHALPVASFVKLVGRTQHGRRSYSCPFCLIQTSSIDVYTRHRRQCEVDPNESGSAPVPQKKLFPRQEAAYVEFDNFNSKFEPDIHVYWDSECILASPSSANGTLDVEEEHEVFSVSCIVLDVPQHRVMYSEYFESNSDADAAQQFLNFLYSVKPKLVNYLNRHEKLSADQRRAAFEKLKMSSDYCHICEVAFDHSSDPPFSSAGSDSAVGLIDGEPEIDSDGELVHNVGASSVEAMKEYQRKRRVVDHCHKSGKVLGLAHASCNINRNKRRLIIPVLSHNGTAYDHNIVIRALHESRWGTSNTKIKLLAKNAEKIREIGLSVFRFRDSLEHLKGSLSSCTEQFLEGNHDYGILKQIVAAHFPLAAEGAHKLINGKLTFPFSIMNSRENLFNFELKNLAPKHFTSKLTGREGTLEDVNAMHGLASEFGLRSLKEVGKLYVLSDAALLAECFVAYARNVRSVFGLSPSNFISASSVVYNAYLYNSKERLPLLCDNQMYDFVRSSFSGGLAGCNDRKASSAFYTFDERTCPEYSEHQKHIVCLDWNCLYPTCSRYLLPAGGFEWMDEDSLKLMEAHLTRTSDPSVPDEYSLNGDEESDNTGKYSCILEVDGHYPDCEDLHHRLGDFPPIFTRRTVHWDQLSPTTRKLYNDDPRTYAESERLIASLLPLRHERVNLDILYYAVSVGFVVTKIWAGLRFHQRPLLKKFMEKLCHLRKTAKTQLQAKIMKDFSNSLVGKLIQNPELYVETRIFRVNESLGKRLNYGHLIHIDPLGKDLVMAQFRPSTVKCRSPVAVGATVLSLSKLYLLFLWDVLNHHWNECRPLYYDTDSLCVSFMSTNFVSDFKKISNIMDFSNLNPTNQMYSTARKNSFGLLKSDTGEQAISQVVALRSKSGFLCV